MSFEHRKSKQGREGEDVLFISRAVGGKLKQTAGPCPVCFRLPRSSSSLRTLTGVRLGRRAERSARSCTTAGEVVARGCRSDSSCRLLFLSFTPRKAKTTTSHPRAPSSAGAFLPRLRSNRFKTFDPRLTRLRRREEEKRSRHPPRPPLPARREHNIRPRRRPPSLRGVFDGRERPA